MHHYLSKTYGRIGHVCDYRSQGNREDPEGLELNVEISKSRIQYCHKDILTCIPYLCADGACKNVVAEFNAKRKLTLYPSFLKTLDENISAFR